MTETHDLVARLLAAIEETETIVAAHIARNGANAILRSCAADRKILGLHDEPLVQVGLDNARFVYCQTCGSGEPNEYPTAWPCDTILALAEGYGLAEQQGDQP